MPSRWFIVMLCAAAACGESTPPTSAPAASSSPPSSSPPATSTGNADEAVGSRMFKHFLRVAALERAVIEGSKKDVQTHATELGKARAGDPAEWAPHVANLQRAAAAVLRATDHRGTAIATATVVAQCGACHRAFGVTIGSQDVPDPPGNISVEQKMKRHQWATDLLRTSIVFDAEPLWKRGGDALFDAALHPSQVGSAGPIDPEIVELIRHVRELAQDARAASRDERQGIYGAVLGTCARCHEKLR